MILYFRCLYEKVIFLLEYWPMQLFLFAFDRKVRGSYLSRWTTSFTRTPSLEMILCFNTRKDFIKVSLSQFALKVTVV